MQLSKLKGLPLILPSHPHGLRAVVDAAFARVSQEPRVVLEVDGLALLMDAVRSGIGATIQPGAATARLPADAVARIEISDGLARRVNTLVSLSNNELSPAALAARIMVRNVARQLVIDGHWPGATLHDT